MMLESEIRPASETIVLSRGPICCNNHLVQFYKNAEYLAISIAEYLRLGLDSGEVGLVIARPEHWAKVKAILVAQGVNVDSLIGKRLLHYINALPLTAQIMHCGAVDRDVFFEQIRYIRDDLCKGILKIRCYGEIVDVLSEDNRISEALVLEGYWNEVLEKDTNFALMCGYQATHLHRRSDVDDFQSIIDVHSNVIEVEPIGLEKDEDAVFRKIAVLEQRSLALTNQVELKHRIDEELAETKAQLLQVGKLTILGDLCAGIAHELNNPLAIIKGSVFLTRRILSRIPDPARPSLLGDALNRLENIEEAANRMTKIVNKVLLFARQKPPTFSDYSINSALIQALGLFQKELAQAGIEVVSLLPEETYLSFGDCDLMVQVFLNVISNARDAIVASERDVRPVLTVAASLASDSEVEIRVTDNGSGMNESTVAKIFYPFFTTKELGQGTGLGLSISHGIVADHKGKITCESTLGEGTTFRIFLPRIES